MLRRHEAWMWRSHHLAQEAGTAGEVPVAAIIVGPDNQLVASAANRKERDQDPTAHAEVLAIRAAAKHLGDWHLNQCTLYVTLEPCPMCAGAIIHARLGLLVYGTSDPKTGAIRSVLNLPDGPSSNHKLVVIGGVLETVCKQQLQDWFKQKRRQIKARSTAKTTLESIISP
ncbi:tRNA adenosine(34) deaminase TadA [Synechococcus sp. PCC 7335]|uniref:tRNA adenosine(34) deaminase TadA n=1 Tax=Synechococcus sp. (strain ATCC 29403 / PCC 7335) TaxID=91464 RepID=UPI0008FEB8AD|nr:tRNA adenosine(34) deaminase TadA [Synechococcus sp. PCC 7335]